MRRPPLLPDICGRIPFVYVMCGARGERAKPLVEALPQARFVGFEPDAEECARLNQASAPRYTYYNVAAGRREEARTLYVTRDPDCISLLPPNPDFYARFQDCGPAIEVRQRLSIQTVALDSFLPANGIASVDFLELDTQGSELDILQGAEGFLSSSIVGLRVEVEFSPIYKGQPLFAELDPYLRNFGFMLFDLSRHHYRRRGSADIVTRGQLLWGDAIYLMDWRNQCLKDRQERTLKLCVIAASLGFHDYALEVLGALREGTAGPLGAEEATLLKTAEHKYRRALVRRSRWQRLSAKLGLAKALRRPARTTVFSWAD